MTRGGSGSSGLGFRRGRSTWRGLSFPEGDTAGARIPEALARAVAVPTNRITGILNGQRAVTGDTALRLAHYFGTSAVFRLNLQSRYELRRAGQKTGEAIKALPRLRERERRHV
jgi:antitoxin HigA-1